MTSEEFINGDYEMDKEDVEFDEALKAVENWEDKDNV